jgi:hypothetical protein
MCVVTQTTHILAIIPVKKSDICFKIKDPTKHGIFFMEQNYNIRLELLFNATELSPLSVSDALSCVFINAFEL